MRIQLPHVCSSNIEAGIPVSLFVTCPVLPAVVVNLAVAAVGLHVDVHGNAAHPLLHYTPARAMPRRSRILRLIGSLPRRHAGQQDVCAPRAVPAGQWTGEGIGGSYI